MWRIVWGKLSSEQRYFIDRIALQEYTQDETVKLTGLRRRTMLRRYWNALDLLTSILLEKGLLEVREREPCEEANFENSFASYYIQ